MIPITAQHIQFGVTQGSIIGPLYLFKHSTPQVAVACGWVGVPYSNNRTKMLSHILRRNVFCISVHNFWFPVHSIDLIM